MRIDNALAQVSKHKNLILVVIGIAAIASYMIPFANLFAVADASGEIWKKSKWEWKVAEKKKKFDFKFAHFFKKLAFKNLAIDNSETTTNIFKNFGVKQFFNFGDINTATAYTGGLTTTTPTSGSAVALNAGTTFFFVNNVLNCPSAAGSGSNSLSDTVSSTSCSNNQFNTQIQVNPYVIFGGSV
jgi:hypothetical protein